MARLICEYFHLGQGQKARAQIPDLFWAKICVFDVKTYFNYVTSQENHILLKFKLSARQNGTFYFRKFLLGARSAEKSPISGPL